MLCAGAQLRARAVRMRKLVPSRTQPSPQSAQKERAPRYRALLRVACFAARRPRGVQGCLPSTAQLIPAFTANAIAHVDDQKQCRFHLAHNCAWPCFSRPGQLAGNSVLSRDNAARKTLITVKLPRPRTVHLWCSASRHGPLINFMPCCGEFREFFLSLFPAAPQYPE